MYYDSANKELLRAVSFALYKHGNQRRNARNAAFIPYMVHPVEVATILMEAGVEDPTTLQVAVLHDVLEDTSCTEEELDMMFGSEVRVLVGTLTDPPNTHGKDKQKVQTERMQKAALRARMVKIADKTSNLRDLVRCPPDWKKSSFEGYIATAYHVMKAADHGDIPQALLRVFWQAYTEMQEWIQEQNTEATTDNSTTTKSTSVA